jgi:predicted dehydrogenase
MTDAPGVAIIGCGLIGQKRAIALSRAKLVACADVIPDRARSLGEKYNAAFTSDWTEVLRRDDVDIVIVATINSLLAEIAAAALYAGKHVLVEKPAARNVAELNEVIAAEKRSGKLVRVGFNHRYHAAFRKAKEIFDSGVLGDMMFVRARYGHGGRIGYEKEWRANPALSGGGELIDQGVHLIDLARQFLGDFRQVVGRAQTLFWDMPVDDNAFMILQTAEERTAFLHVSCTEWKNLFSLEIYGRNGKLQVDGLGGSYGVERLTYYRMLPEMGPPETTPWEFPGPDRSWELEFAEFLDDIRQKRRPAANLNDARAVLKIVEDVYSQSGYDFG